MGSSTTTLGLDLGPNSIGWALVKDNNDGTGRLVDCGVRVFPEGVDAFDTGKESSRNEQRRTARMMRRQIRRRARRKQVVAAALVEAGLLPGDEAERAKIFELDPYPLRAAAVERKLEPFEIGRVIYHLNQRRGFLSLKKVSKSKLEKEVKALQAKRPKKSADVLTSSADGTESTATAKKDDDSKMLAEIELLAQRMAGRTLGETLLADQLARAIPLTNDRAAPGAIRGQHTRRAMIEDEFLRVWAFQLKYHPSLLTDQALHGTAGRQDALRTRLGMARDRSKSLLQQFGLHGLIFQQRPIYWPREMIGMCDLEKGQRRCHRADRQAQRFRMLQEINNLRYAPSGRMGDERPLDDAERAKLLDALYTKDRLEFTAIRKLLGLIESAAFNLERGERASIKGCETDVRIAKEWKGWRDLDDATKDGIIRVVIDAERDVGMARDALMGKWNLDEASADVLLSIDLPDGYVGYSLKAIEKLMPFLERGMILASRVGGPVGAIEAAGYTERHALERRLFDKLPSLAEMRSGPLAELPNPVVRAAMYELRRVVNAIVREYGVPDAVNIEMARSLKEGSEKRKKRNRENRERADERQKTASLLRDELHVVPTRDAILKYRLWKEQHGRCVYTGDEIGIEQLYNGDTDIDHILPYSITLDDSQSNKVVCFRKANHEKGQQSPWEWLAGRDPERLKQIEQWTQPLPWNKRRKFVQQEIKGDDFIERQLVDTGYIARLAAFYLQLLVEKRHEVQGRKGTYTADLRKEWGLGKVIESLPESPAWREPDNELPPGEKNRADHRHHALDAIVIALTSRRTLAAMHQGKELAHHTDRVTGEVVEYQRFVKEIPPPWKMERDAFRQMIADKLSAVNVSHSVRRAVRGGLHEETIYGPTFERMNGVDRKAKRKLGEFVVRKRVESLTPAEVENIRDAAIRKLVIDRLAEHGIKIGRGETKVPPKKMQEAMKDLKMASGVPVKKVRVLRKELTIRPIREGKPDEVWVKPGSTHHLAIFEWDEPGKNGKPKTVRDAVFVSMLEAKQRIKRRETIIQRTHPDRPDARFILSLSAGELVSAKVKGRDDPLLLTFKTAASTQGQIYFALATDARRSGDQQKFVFKSSTLDARKVTVDPLGRIRWAGD